MSETAFLAELENELAARLEKRILASAQRRLLKIRDAAEYLGCDVKQVRNFMAAGKLDNVKLDGHVRLDVRDLDRFIEASKQ